MINAVYRFQKHSVGKSDFGNPKATYHVSPTAIIGLFKGPSTIRTQTTFHGSRRTEISNDLF